MHQVVSVALKQVLRQEETVHVNELIGALWRLKESSADSLVIEACERAIRLLARKLN